MCSILVIRYKHLRIVSCLWDNTTKTWTDNRIGEKLTKRH